MGKELDPRLIKLYHKIEELEQQERWPDLVSVYEECIRISLEIYGEYDDETIALYTEYGGLLRNLGRYEEALSILDKALKCVRATRGTQHPDYAASLVNLANLLRMMRYNKESEALFLNAKKIYEMLNATGLFEYVGLCNNLGLLYQQMKRYKEAIPLHRKCLDLLKNDSEHVILYGITLNNLVEPYKAIGDRRQAVVCLKKALTIFRENIDHATVLYAAAMNNLGAIYYEDGEYEKARDSFAKAMGISKEKLGTSSESYQNSLSNYQQTLRKIEMEKNIKQRNKQSSYVHSSDFLSGHLHYASCQSLDMPTFTADNIHGKADARKTGTTLPMTDNPKPRIKEKPETTEKPVIVNREHDILEIKENSKGLDIAQGYFFDVCYPVLKEKFSHYLPRMAAGLVGEGSECYGYDDQISRDHDFGPCFQIYIPAEDMGIYGTELQQVIAALPKTYHGFEARTASTYGDGRIGVFSIERFYEKYLSIHEVPTTNRLWLQMNDIALSTATNGRVFVDHLGRFSEIREGLLRHYPKDVRLKRMAAECMQIAQSGQYNLPRSLQRKRYVAATHAREEFISHICSLIHLINKTYKPYYKWEQESLKHLPILGQYASREIDKLVLVPLNDNPNYVIFIVESLCQKCIEYLQEHQLTSSHSDFLLDHGPQILARIEDESLRMSNPWTFH